MNQRHRLMIVEDHTLLRSASLTPVVGAVVAVLRLNSSAATAMVGFNVAFMRGFLLTWWWGGWAPPS